MINLLSKNQIYKEINKDTIKEMNTDINSEMNTEINTENFKILNLLINQN